MIVIALAGLPGSGKSTLARALAGRLHATVLDKDRARAAMFGPGVDGSRAQNDRACHATYAAAEALAAAGEPFAILDGRTYSQRYQVEELRAFAERVGARLQIVECVCGDDIARERLERDARSGAHPAPDREFELYVALRDAAERIEGDKLVVRTDDEALGDVVERVLRALGVER